MTIFILECVRHRRVSRSMNIIMRELMSNTPPPNKKELHLKRTQRGLKHEKCATFEVIKFCHFAKSNVCEYSYKRN
jgi:hypothetical protein